MPPPDVEILHAINRWPDALSPFLTFFSVAMNLGWVKFLLSILLIVLLAARGRYGRCALQALFAVAIANTLTDQFKHFVPENRPYQDLQDVINRVGTSTSAGTASAHSANMAAVAVIFCFHLGRWGYPWVAVALLTGLSRVYVGAHYPYQVCLGWFCGGLSALAVIKFWNFILMKRGIVVKGENPHEESKPH